MLSVKTYVNNPVASNCYVLFDKGKGKECIIVDPGSKYVESLFESLEAQVLIPKFIILTHEHFDHCWSVNAIVERFHIPIICSKLCAEAIGNEKKNCSVFFDNQTAFRINTATICSDECSPFDYLGDKIVFYNTPGHTEAGISFTIGQYLFTGDTLIKDLRTVTKLPTGSRSRLLESLHLYSLLQGHAYHVCPGHGDLFLLDEYDLSLALNGGNKKSDLFLSI